ncbi:MAG: hypothetical protein AAFQ40_13080 [Cyanobacteria bacterium J06623_5]
MNKDPLARRTPSSPPASLPKTGYVTIAGKRHLVRIEPHQPPPFVIQQDSAPTAQYQVPRDRQTPKQQSPRLQLPNPLQLALALITMTLFLVGASMFSISLTAYSNSVERTDRIRRLIHVE